MTKPQLIQRIRSHNPSANEPFLAAFNEPALIAYLGRLDRLANRRGPDSRWVHRQPRFLRAEDPQQAAPLFAHAA